MYVQHAYHSNNLFAHDLHMFLDVSGPFLSTFVVEGVGIFVPRNRDFFTRSDPHDFIFSGKLLRSV